MGKGFVGRSTSWDVVFLCALLAISLLGLSKSAIGATACCLDFDLERSDKSNVVSCLLSFCCIVIICLVTFCLVLRASCF